MLESLIELLLKNRIITPTELQRAIEEQSANGGRMESLLVRMGYLQEQDLVSFLCDLCKVPFFKLSQFNLKADVIKLISAEHAKKYLIIPVHKVRSKLTLAMVDPSDMEVIEEVRSLTGLEIEPVGASETEIVNTIKKYYGEESDITANKTVLIQKKDHSG